MQTERVQSAADAPDYVRPNGPERITRVLLLAITLGLCDQTYWMYSNMDRWQHGYEYWKTFIDGAGLAPEQYRIGVKWAAWLMVEHFGWGFRHGFALMDVFGTLATVYLIYALLQRRPEVRHASAALQWFASAAFVALTCFYLGWVGSYFRPETLPTAGFAAVIVWAWATWDYSTSGSGRWWRPLALLAACLVQAFIRADVPFALSAGMLFACATHQRSDATDRRLKIVVSVLCVGITAAVQLYLTKVRYPHASYGPIPILMIRYDLRQPLTFPPFLCFMLPVAWTFVRFWRDRAYRFASQTDLGLVVGSALYLVLWIVMGKLDEVRIFIPFAMALAPLTIGLAMRRIGTVAIDPKSVSLDSSG